MSVIVKDMEIPTSCTMCWLNTFCGVWNTEPVKYKGFNERLENCPLTELIQCKDCKHYERDFGNDWGICCKWVIKQTGITVDKNGFCYKAERNRHDD